MRLPSSIRHALNTCFCYNILLKYQRTEGLKAVKNPIPAAAVAIGLIALGALSRPVVAQDEDRVAQAALGVPGSREDGAANPAIEKALNAQIQDLKSPEVQSKSDADLKKAVTDGQGKMRPIPSVSGASLDNVIAYIRSLKK